MKTAKQKTQERAFAISFFESVLTRDPRDPAIIEPLAHLYTEAERYEEGLALDHRLVQLEPENATAHYNLACSFALTGQVDVALKQLREAFQLGYRDVDWMLNDEDLETVRTLPGFSELLAQYGGED